MANYKPEWELYQEERQKRNLKRLRYHEKNFNKTKGVRVGDWIRRPNGEFTRVTYIWRDEKGVPFQYQTGGNGGSYHLGSYNPKNPIFGLGMSMPQGMRASTSYSGGLDSGYTTKEYKFKNLGYKRLGDVWIWDEGIVGAGRGVDMKIEFRVFEAIKIR